MSGQRKQKTISFESEEQYKRLAGLADALKKRFQGKPSVSGLIQAIADNRILLLPLAQIGFENCSELIQAIAEKRYVVMPSAKHTALGATPGLYMLVDKNSEIKFVASTDNLMNVPTNQLFKLNPSLVDNSVLVAIKTSSKEVAVQTSLFLQRLLSNTTSDSPPNFQEKWSTDHIQSVLQAIWLAQESGQYNVAYILAGLLRERNEVGLIVKEQINYLETKNWFLIYGQLQLLLKQKEKFRVIDENGSSFNIFYARFDQPPGEKHLYLAAFCEEENSRELIPELARNHSFRLDQICSVEPLGQPMAAELPIIHARFLLYENCGQGKNDKPSEHIRQVWSSHWFFKEILQYGDAVEVLERTDLRQLACDRLLKALQRYQEY